LRGRNTGKTEWQPEFTISLNQTVKGEITMFYICDKFGFVSDFYKDTNIHGEQVLKAKHCIDAREAFPFKSKGEAEAKYRRTYMSSWWHCVLSSIEQEEMTAS
jgi:hypothetical protein